MKHTGLTPNEAKQALIKEIRDVIDRCLTHGSFDKEVFIPVKCTMYLMHKKNVEKYILPLYNEWDTKLIERATTAMVGPFEIMEEGYLFKPK